MKIKLRLSSLHHQTLYKHLFPGDGKEAVAICLAGRHKSTDTEFLLVHEVMPIPYDDCIERAPNYLHWSTDKILEIMPKAISKDMAIVKIHSHPGGYPKFSLLDDASDKLLFSSVYGWYDHDRPHASLIMLPDQSIVGRTVAYDGAFSSINQITIVGDEMKIFPQQNLFKTMGFDLKNRQVLGAGTTQLLRRLKIGVIGCSGTGSPVIEQLTRLGVGNLLLVDPDIVEHKNLNRILNSKKEDADKARLKVDILSESMKAIGTEINIEVYADDILQSKRAQSSLISCDFIFGCVDSIDARDFLNSISTFYIIPYLDLGVKVVADGAGGVEQICGSIHYVQPGKSSLMTRGLYSSEDLRATTLRKASPDRYNDLVKEKYISGIQVDSPAIISVNMLIAAYAVNDFLARIHSIRLDDNNKFATTRISISDSYVQHEQEGPIDLHLAKYLGRGDMTPFLNQPRAITLKEAG